jgi:hypothetical protein
MQGVEPSRILGGQVMFNAWSCFVSWKEQIRCVRVTAKNRNICYFVQAIKRGIKNSVAGTQPVGKLVT